MRLLLLYCAISSLCAQELLWRKSVPGEAIAGAAADSQPGFYTWGRRLLQWDGPRFRELARPPHGYHDGGCAYDAAGDGRTSLILAERPAEGALGILVWLSPPDFRPIPIDDGVELHDCLPATLFGRRGFLMIHRHAQVRFYWLENSRWSMKEIYSIYTASRQGGLALADIDGDGRTDIYCGNYWVRSPENFDLPWRIFAINLHHQEFDAANFVFAAWPDRLLAAQRERDATTLRWFVRPADPTQLWTEQPGPPIAEPRAALRVGGQAWTGGRTIRVLPRGLEWPPGHSVHALLPGGIAVGPAMVTRWRLQP